MTKAGYTPKKTPETWHAISRVGLQDWTNKALLYDKKELAMGSDTCPLFPHQHIIKDYLQEDSPYRSLMLYQGLGTGKTRASIAVAEVLSTHYKILVMVPASLEGNYREEILRCANDVYKTAGFWSFVPKKLTDTEYKEAHKRATQELGITEQTIKKNKGIWVISKTGPKKDKYETLTGENQLAITKQIDDMLAARYTFAHYNGLRIASAKRLILDTNSFKDYVIIIDEVHNFIKTVVNGSIIAKAVYNTIRKCDSCKVLLLSGTPIINRPIELGALCNLARGPLHTVTAKIDSRSLAGKRTELQQMLETVPWIDMFDIDMNGLTIVPLPRGFVWVDRKARLIGRDAKKSVETNEEYPAEVRAVLKKVGLKASAARGRKSAADDNETDSIKLESSWLFPDDEKTFDEMFVDYGAFAAKRPPVKNTMMIARRLQGIISHFESYDASQFPAVGDTEVVRVDMPDGTFAKYMNKRNDEVAKEQNAKKMDKNLKNAGPEAHAKQELTKSNNVYRCFSRALCNFSFPDAINRPYPSSMKDALAEMDDLDGDDEGDVEDDDLDGKKVSAAAAAASDSDDNAKDGKKSAVKKSKKLNKSESSKAYTAAKDKALKTLYDNADKYLMNDGLMKHSPKYAEILRRINMSQGPVVVYSQFRNVEGHGVLSLVLRAHGFAELKIKKSGATGEWELDMSPADIAKPKYVAFSSDKGKNKVMLAIYNSEFDMLPSGIHGALENAGIKDNLHGEFVKVMLITQSGAEGISLKNVRQVHLMEPYWNMVRMKQVIGRAVRAGSHLALPVNEHKVNVYMYLTCFSTAQKKNKLVESREEGLTSDEYILGVAERKGTITDTLLTLMKQSAVDCIVHRAAHESKGYSCIKIPKDFGSPAGALYSYKSINDDPTDEVAAIRTVEATITRKIAYITKGEKRYPYDTETNELFDPKEFEKKNFVVVAKIIMKDGKPKIVKV